MRHWFLWAVVALCFIRPSLADLAQGIASFEQGDYEAASSEFEPLAMSGDPRAQYLLGVIYLNGLLDPPASDTAVRWIRKSAEQGYLQAQTELARMYRTGDGVPNDFAEMVNWYRRAARQGEVGAQLFLADSYAYGVGTKPDLRQAYMWYEIAIRYWGPLAVRARDVIAQKMTPAQVADATRLAEEWLRENEN